MHLITAACIGMFLLSQDCRGQEHLGCYTDSRTDRLLPMLGNNSANNTVDACIEFCKSKGTTYAGVTLATECWCGDMHNLSRHGVVTESESYGTWCNYRCSGNKSQICGGVGRINVYSVCPRGRYHNPGGDVGNCDSECYCNASHICLYSTGQCPGGCQNGWYGTSCSLNGQEHLGCYTNSRTDRLLPMLGNNSANNTVDTCIEFCKSKGTTYAGVTLATECWCGDVHNLSRHGVVTEPDSNGAWCNFPCSGNKSQICGGLVRLNVYSVCPRGRYHDPGGDVGNCDSECYCSNSHICLYSTGQCPGGCQEGWYGTICSLNALLTTPSSGTTAMGSSTIGKMAQYVISKHIIENKRMRKNKACRATNTHRFIMCLSDAILSLETTAGSIMTYPTRTITRAAKQVAGIASGTTVALLAVLVILGMVLVYFCRHQSRRRNSSSHIQPRGPMERTTEGVDGRMQQAIRVDTCVDKYDTKASSGANGKYAGDTTDAVYYNTKVVTGVGGSDGYANSQPKELLVDKTNSTGVYEETHGYMNMSTEPTYTPLNQSAVYQNIE